MVWVQNLVGTCSSLQVLVGKFGIIHVLSGNVLNFEITWNYLSWLPPKKALPKKSRAVLKIGFLTSWPSKSPHYSHSWPGFHVDPTIERFFISHVWISTLNCCQDHCWFQCWHLKLTDLTDWDNLIWFNDPVLVFGFAIWTLKSSKNPELLGRPSFTDVNDTVSSIP